MFPDGKRRHIHLPESFKETESCLAPIGNPRVSPYARRYYWITLIIVLLAVGAAGIQIAAQPMYVMLLLVFKFWSLAAIWLIVFGVCLIYDVRSWLKTIGVIGLGGVLALLFVLITQIFFAIECNNLLARAPGLTPEDFSALTRFELVKTAARAPVRGKEPARWRLHWSENRVGDRTHGNSRASAIQLKFQASGIGRSRSEAAPECHYVMDIHSLHMLIDVAAKGGSKVISERNNCISAEQADALFNDIRLEMGVLRSSTAGKDLTVVARVLSPDGKVLQTLIFAFTDPWWYGFPFNIYAPLACTSPGMQSAPPPPYHFWFFPGPPPHRTSLAVAAALKAVHEMN